MSHHCYKHAADADGEDQAQRADGDDRAGQGGLQVRFQLLPLRQAARQTPSSWQTDVDQGAWGGGGGA